MDVDQRRAGENALKLTGRARLPAVPRGLVRGDLPRRFGSKQRGFEAMRGKKHTTLTEG